MLIASPRLVMFGQNICLLIFLLAGAGLLLLLIIASWTGLKILSWKSQQNAAEAAERKRKYQPDGTPYPPRGRGLCDRCHMVGDAIFHLPNGERRCDRCWRNAAGVSSTEV